MPAHQTPPDWRRRGSRRAGSPPSRLLRGLRRVHPTGWAAALASLSVGLILTTTAAPAVEQPAATETAPTTTEAPAAEVPPAHLARGVPFGIGDESPAMFSDPLFKWLGIRYARLVIPWNVTRSEAELSYATTWLNDAKQAGVQPLVSFDKNINAPKELPTLPNYQKAVTEFMTLFPWVTN